MGFRGKGLILFRAEGIRGGNLLVAVLSDKPDLRAGFCGSFGKEISKGDVSFYKAGNNTLMDPTLYPEKIQPLLYTLSMADYVVLLVDGLTPKVGEMMVALDSLKLEKGTIVSKTALPLAGTILEKYQKAADNASAMSNVSSAQASYPGENAVVLVTKTEAVKSIGNVALGAVRSGKLKKADRFFVLPEKKELEVRSIIVDGTEVEEASAGSKVDLAFKGELFERGILAPLRNDYEIGNIVNGHFKRSPFFKDELKGRIHAYTNLQYVEGMVTDNDITLSAPLAYEKGEQILIIDASNQKLRIAGVFASKW